LPATHHSGLLYAELDWETLGRASKSSAGQEAAVEVLLNQEGAALHLAGCGYILVDCSTHTWNELRSRLSPHVRFDSQGAIIDAVGRVELEWAVLNSARRKFGWRSLLFAQYRVETHRRAV
jgi:hypothetical protein